MKQALERPVVVKEEPKFGNFVIKQLYEKREYGNSPYLHGESQKGEADIKFHIHISRRGKVEGVINVHMKTKDEEGKLTGDFTLGFKEKGFLRKHWEFQKEYINMLATGEVIRYGEIEKQLNELFKHPDAKEWLQKKKEFHGV